MTKLEQLLKSLLDTLPFNGEKLKMSLWVALYAFLSALLPDVMPWPAQAPAPATLGFAGILSALTGYYHKVLKDKFDLFKRYGNSKSWPNA